ncbi:uncharacterized protein K444DRAFT_221897 [Hyaloscypha bicolor E]|uniref:Uncharacterized protein n=1 Tax=Hyaloscypha bicolor E TaxID=1095630 RepID=A0A2J6SJN3_9HELO|nr:uncharacterized protein K444DRAFT_221897 [Hyaloscypha bicolor E]PMD50950.1 hypothetical protein K444DRAFT_221897 [Hyaloscypha bicolor E]
MESWELSSSVIPTLSTPLILVILLCQADGEEEGNPASWIDFSLFLNESMDLKGVNFRQKLSNGVCRAGYCPSADSKHDYICCSNRRVNDSNPFDCLRYRIEGFLTLDEPCPLKSFYEDADLRLCFGLPWIFTTDRPWEFRARDLPNFSQHESVPSND